MRDDLLDAQAAVDWAISQFPSFQQRLTSWLQRNINLEIEELDSNTPNNVIVAVEKEPLPLFFNVEVGAYINVLRSSLDILATAIATRYGVPRPDKAYFPVAQSATEFASGGYKGVEFVKALPATERAIIESLAPYKGGNAPLWALHQLDIMRKHKRLLSVAVNPARFSITGWSLHEHFTPIAIGWLPVNEKTALGLIAKGAPKYDMKFTPYVAINETTLLERQPIAAALSNFASLAKSIVRLFDTP